ncbi:MAG: mechanosensitive ion channel family protein [Gemmatimonadales bacterium]|jgi:miniconductance mechanosensitive channel
MTLTALFQADADQPSLFSWLSEPTLAAQVTGLLLVALAALLADKLAKQVLLATVRRIVRTTSFDWDDVLQDYQVFGRFAHLVPALAIYYGTQLVPGLSDTVEDVITHAALAATILVALLVAGALLSAVNDLYSRTPAGRDRPIKGYIQIAKILLYVLGGIVMIATLIGQNPLLFLSGIGAMTAVLLLIFRDTILSFVASLQVASYDLVRVGDWIEAPQYGADGDVIDIALHTIKIQNWDKTITTVPTHKLIDGAFKNWRGMTESGGRRVKRALYIDMNTIRFLDAADVQRLGKIALLEKYVRRKRHELERDGASEAEIDTNRRRLTNLGTFRAYVANYLRQHPKVHQGMTLMVRQRDPTPDGLPLEIYAFTNTTDWVEYEGIQSDIFDHMLAVAPEFGLRVFQHPSGRDFERAFAGRGPEIAG